MLLLSHLFHSERLRLWLQEGSLEGSSSGSGHKENSKQAPDKTQVIMPLLTCSVQKRSREETWCYSHCILC